jgi:hypothetical protein
MFASLLHKISLGAPSAYRNLTLTPIFLKNGPLSDVEPLSVEEALAAGTLEVTEVSAEGHVPELRVRNSGKTPVLILDGEELVGAKQNRIVNVTILVAPQSDIVIPVSCTEAGRWGYSRPGFAAAGRVLNQEVRYSKAAAVTKNLKECRVRSADQGAVWDGVSKALFALGATSPTSALGDGFDSRANDIDDFLETLKPQPGQIGVIYRIGGKLAGLDLFGSKRAFAQAYAKLVRGSALQALTGFPMDANTSLEDHQFLSAVLSAPDDRFPAVGLGEELRYDTGEIGGGALELEGSLIHLFAFPQRSAAKPDQAKAHQ